MTTDDTVATALGYWEMRALVSVAAMQARHTRKQIERKPFTAMPGRLDLRTAQAEALESSTEALKRAMDARWPGRRQADNEAIKRRHAEGAARKAAGVANVPA